ncbi:hypothetical protein Tco_1232514 [Tanacetum coccineum]
MTGWQRCSDFLRNSRPAELRKRVEEEKNVKDNEVVNESVLEPDTSDAAVPLKEVDKVNGAENRTGDEPVRRGLKHTDALVDQGSDVNVMPLSFYNKLTDEIPAETDIRLSLASHSYIYPLGIAEDVLVEIVAKAMIKFDKGTITLRSRENKISFHRMPEPLAVEENGQTRPMKYSKLTEAQQLQDDCDVQATSIILHGLPPDVYALVNHQEAAKDIWDRVKILMKGTELSYQERECRLYNLFDKFAYVQGETLYEKYWRFSQLINDMHIIGMTMQQV